MQNNFYRPSDISVECVSKSFADKTVLSNVSFTVKGGSTAVIQGASGSGKTTLIRIIAGLIKPDSGSVNGITPDKVSFLFQDDRLFPWLTALQNVEAVIKQKDGKMLARELLDMLGLGSAADMNAYPSELSGGMNRRVAIARALAYDSELLILDEALRGLDEANTENTISVIKQYSRGKTLISVTHKLSSLESDADQFISL